MSEDQNIQEDGGEAVDQALQHQGEEQMITISPTRLLLSMILPALGGFDIAYGWTHNSFPTIAVGITALVVTAVCFLSR